MFKLSVFVFCIVLLCVSAKEEVYSNSWAVEVKGGHHVADALAKKHGFINKGQVSDVTYNYRTTIASSSMVISMMFVL